MLWMRFLDFTHDNSNSILGRTRGSMEELGALGFRARALGKNKGPLGTFKRNWDMKGIFRDMRPGNNVGFS